MMTAIFDLDGVLSTGQFLYNENGKCFKIFGPDDALALQKLRAFMPIHIVSGDKRAWNISAKRVRDMGFELEYAPSEGRVDWVEQYGIDWKELIYMGDSFTDIDISVAARYSICPADAFHELRNIVDYVCVHSAGHRAVAEAVFHIIGKRNVW